MTDIELSIVWLPVAWPLARLIQISQPTLAKFGADYAVMSQILGICRAVRRCAIGAAYQRGSRSDRAFMTADSLWIEIPGPHRQCRSGN